MSTSPTPSGYLAQPAAGSGPAVLVLHAWWGLNDDIRTLCDRLAAEGFVAYAPDLYHDQLATTIEEAERLAGALDSERAQAETRAAVEQLLHYSSNPAQGVRVIGFSLGAAYATLLSGDEPTRVRAVVLFYGVGGGDFARSQASYLGHFAEADPYEPAESVAWLAQALASAGRPFTPYVYPGVGHWFCEPGRPDAYNEAAAQLAWERTLAFLRA